MAASVPRLMLNTQLIMKLKVYIKGSVRQFHNAVLRLYGPCISFLILGVNIRSSEIIGVLGLSKSVGAPMWWTTRGGRPSFDYDHSKARAQILQS